MMNLIQGMLQSNRNETFSEISKWVKWTLDVGGDDWS